MKLKEFLKDEMFWTGLLVFVGLPALASYIFVDSFELARFLLWAIPIYVFLLFLVLASLKNKKNEK